MQLKNIFIICKEERKEIVEGLIQRSYPGLNFHVLMILASCIAAIGLIIDNMAIIIGSMLVAPILYPVLCLGMSASIRDFNIIKRTLFIIIKIVVLGVSIGFLSALVFRSFVRISETGVFLENFMLPIFYVSIVSGLAASFAITRKSSQEFLSGVAVSIFLIPPLVNIGVALGSGHMQAFYYSLQIFAINIFGIFLASITVFSLMGFSRESKTAQKIIKEEEKYLKKGAVEFGDNKK